MADGVFTLKHGRVFIRTAGGAPTEVELGPGMGDLTISGLEAKALGALVQSEAVPVMDRSNFLELVEGAQTFPTLSLNIYHRGLLTDSVNRRAVDTLLNLGKVLAAADVTVDPGGIVWTCDWLWRASRAGVSAGWDFGNVRSKLDYNEAADGNKIPISGIVYGAVAPS